MTESPHAPARIASFSSVLAVFGSSVATAALVGRRRGVQLPERFPTRDLVLGGLATFKFARILTKDAVTTPLRAPFTEFEENTGAGEVNERPKEGHPLHTIGDLLTCPFCMAPWIASGYVAALAFSPRLARTWAAVFSMVAVSDSLQFGYDALRQV
jgi:Protein of unknown function (DUF1360)